MNTAAYVIRHIQEMKESGMDGRDIVWQAGKDCVGWPYIFGALGQECTPAYRRQAYASKGDEHPTIKSACKNFDGDAGCGGCKWYPDDQRVMSFDCRGFTRKLLQLVYGWTLQGGGCTSQWNNESNWKAKGTIDSIPEDTLVCLFYPKASNKKVMEHTGFGYKGETLECSSGVQFFGKRKSKWTHWAIPACVGGEVPAPEPYVPTTDKPTLRRGSKGEYVTLLQTELLNKGYDLGSYGVDGDFGRATEAAVKAFQAANGLTADGIVGAKTWNALLASGEAQKLYTVTVPHLTKAQADALVKQYPSAYQAEEG